VNEKYSLKTIFKITKTNLISLYLPVRTALLALVGFMPTHAAGAGFYFIFFADLQLNALTNKHSLTFQWADWTVAMRSVADSLSGIK
jgi:hypothetical protein